jgi:hypothetical protein
MKRAVSRVYLFTKLNGVTLQRTVRLIILTANGDIFVNTHHVNHPQKLVLRGRFEHDIFSQYTTDDITAFNFNKT